MCMMWAALCMSCAQAPDCASGVCDGAVCLRDVYPREAIAGLLDAWDRIEADPAALGLQTPGEERRRVSGGDTIISNSSHHVPDFMRFILESPVPELLWRPTRCTASTTSPVSSARRAM